MVKKNYAEEISNTVRHWHGQRGQWPLEIFAQLAIL